MSSGRGSASGRGSGRGQMLRTLLDSQSSASSSSKSTDGQGTPADSGVGATHLSSSPETKSTTGRGRVMREIASAMEAQRPPGGRGRAMLLANLLSTAGTSRDGDSGHKSPGRGQLFGEASSSSGSFEKGHIAEVEKIAEEMEKTVISEVSEVEVEPEAVIRRGKAGHRVAAVSNYIRLNADPNKGVFEYEVRFSPNVDSRNLRMRFLNEHRDKFGGTKTFDGVTLYLPILLPDKITTYTSVNQADNTQIKISVIYKRKKILRDCMHLYNVLFDRVMKTLNYVRFDRKQYDPTSPHIIPQYKLEVWPGYVTAVDEYEGGVMLCCDVSHRLLCQTTVLDTLKQVYHANPRMFQENAKKALLGCVVITRYNNKTYRIDDINFDANPLATFQTRTSEISYLDYYKSQYNITINDPKQPLLISIKKQRVANKESPEELIFCLIPEICYLTGLRDDLRSDFKIMREIAACTRVTPNQRVQALEKFYSNVSNCKEAREILQSWGLTLAGSPEKLDARQLDEETVYFRSKSYSAGPTADFGRYATNNELLEVINFQNWLLIHTRNDSRFAKSFMDCLEKNSRPMGIVVQKPKVYVLNDDRTDTYVNALRDQIRPDTQIVVLICPTSRDDRYAAIKKICCAEIPIPSQVINGKTLSNETKNRSIVQKIALQMNCKLGGTLWSINIPFKKVMICGIDTYHDAGQRGNSVSAFVASLNDTYTKWYSQAIIQTKKEEIVNSLSSSLVFALRAHQSANGHLPDRIIIFRDGVGDGQLNTVSQYEIPQLEEACGLAFSNYTAKITFIVVQKRINTRLFAQTGRGLDNPQPGFIVDHTVTRKHLYDFFLVSQSVRQGTVSPSHFIVLKDASDFAPDVLQRLSYKLCFLYYNWPGTVRVPACCQYAHKLAYLVGQNIKRPTSEKLANKLFYL